MTMISRIASISLLTLALSAAACGGTTATDQAPPATAQSAMTTAPIGVGTHGAVKIAGDALGEVPLRADQRAELEKLAADAEARHQAAGMNGQVRKDLVEAIALQVEAGKIDRAALQPKIDAAAAAWQSVQDQDRAALERVHALLDASQREKFVDALESHMKAAKGEWHSHGRDHMKSWAADLNLTDAQRDQLKDAFRAKMKERSAAGHDFRSEMKSHHENAEKVLEAFKGDRFVLDEVAPKKDPKVVAAKMSDGILGMVETALPILTPQQRTIAAGKIRSRGDAPMAPMHAAPF
jgi:Spy/CpxP family protein refolding chaperone